MDIPLKFECYNMVIEFYGIHFLNNGTDIAKYIVECRLANVIIVKLLIKF